MKSKVWQSNVVGLKRQEKLQHSSVFVFSFSLIFEQFDLGLNQCAASDRPLRATRAKTAAPAWLAASL